MGGRYVSLEPGRYTLDVSEEEGPAGVRRKGEAHVRVPVSGGRVEFEVERTEEAYYWWRGPAQRPGVRLLGALPASGSHDGSGSVTRSRPTSTHGVEEASWPTATTG